MAIHMYPVVGTEVVRQAGCSTPSVKLGVQFQRLLGRFIIKLKDFGQSFS